MSLEPARMKSLHDQHLEELSNDDLKDEIEKIDKDGLYHCEKCGHNHKYDSKIGKKHYEK